jgi:hypothetical protein
MAASLNLAYCTSKFCPEKPHESRETLQFLSTTLTHPVLLGELATTHCLKILVCMLFKNTENSLKIMDEESARNCTSSPWVCLIGQ